MHKDKAYSNIKLSASVIEAPTFYVDSSVKFVEQPALKKTETLNVIERLSRALNFYSAAVPVFASYTALDISIAFKRDFLNINMSQENQDKEYEKIHEWGSDIITEKIKELKGFYVKTGQIISTRVDIFPEQYTSKLAFMQDSLDPLPVALIKRVVQDDLLNGADLSELFLEFDDEPLGSASIAQVHKAKLLDGRVVAVKVQRPGIEAKLLGDITNLKNFAKFVSDALPIDYYKVFCELEKTLVYELDFLHEAQATAKVAAAVAHSPSNKPTIPPVIVPLPIPGLCSRRVIVMEFVDGVALSKLAQEMAKKGIKPGSPESILFGKKLLGALTDAYSNMIFGSGIIHGDPHPGNIFVMKGGMGEVALLDCGQVKQCSTPQRLSLARLILLIDKWETLNIKINNLKIFDKKYSIALEKMELDMGIPGDVGDEGSPYRSELNKLVGQSGVIVKQLSAIVQSFGVVFKGDVKSIDDCAAALVILLFGNTGTKLPGGYAGEEISKDSPILQIAEFPQELVLLGRATVMIKGIANRLGLRWSLSERWAGAAREALGAVDNPKEFMPIWSVVEPTVATTGSGTGRANFKRLQAAGKRVRFAEVISSFRDSIGLVFAYIRMKLTSVASKYLSKFLTEDRLRKLLGHYVKVKEYFTGLKKA